ncbi:MAG: hypothetical protein U0869_20805 [Chloroflexota bacterium]
MSGPGGGPRPWSPPPSPAPAADGRRLRPAPLGSLFEIAARIVRRHWAVLLGVSAVFGIPGALLEAVASVPFSQTVAGLLPDPGTAERIVISDADARELAGGLALATGGSFVAGMLAAVAAVGFAWVVWRDYHGRRAPVGEALSRSVARALPALGTAILSGIASIGVLVVGAGAVLGTLTVLSPDGAERGGLGPFLALVLAVVTVLVLVVLAVRWSLAASVVAIEPVGPVGALRRSWRLTADSTWRTFGALFATTLFVTVVGALVSQILALVLVDLVLAPLGAGLLGETLVSTAVTVLFAPVSTVVMTVYLFDQMVRREGWDLPAPEAALAAQPPA